MGVGGGGSFTREKVREATVYKADCLYPPVNCINSD
jgi:hypothetical protein